MKSLVKRDPGCGFASGARVWNQGGQGFDWTRRQYALSFPIPVGVLLRARKTSQVSLLFVYFTRAEGAHQTKSIADRPAAKESIPSNKF